LFSDTLVTHGPAWAFDYYVGKHGMAAIEFGLWFRIACGREFEGVAYYQG
jgi:hypothetical protein